MRLMVENSAVPNMIKGKSMSRLKKVSSFSYKPKSLSLLYTLEDNPTVRKKLTHNGK